MPALPQPSVRSIVERAGLGLRLRSGDARTPEGTDRAIRWVAVSELEDPRPFLEGGELVLSTGMRLAADDRSAWRGYVDRLLEAEVSAFGLGVGLSHDSVPPALLDAAAARGLVILEVPPETPFIAVTKAVSAMVAAQEYESTTRAFEIQRDLTRAALGRDALERVAGRLARGLAAWVLVLDPSAGVLAASPDAGMAQDAGLAAEVEALRARGPLSSAAIDRGAERVVLHPLGAGGTVRGFLAVGRGSPFDPTDLAMIAVAVSLLSLVVERREGETGAGDKVRSAVLTLLLSGADAELLPLEQLGWGWLAGTAVRVLRVGPELGTEPAIQALEITSADRAVGVMGNQVVALVPDRPSDRAAVAGLLQRFAAGGSAPASLDTLPSAFEQAGRALEMARDHELVWHDEVAATGLRTVVEPKAARVFVDSLLAPLDATGGKADLLRSLRVWLAHNGQWDMASRELGVHRHTLRYRIRRAEELLGRSLDDPALRAELWFALDLRGDQTE